MIGCWVLFPLILGALAFGCGLLVETVAGRSLPGTLLLPVGYALIVVVAQVPAQADATAELGLPLLVALAVAGLGFGYANGRLRTLRPDGLATATALVVFAVFAAPVVLSGEATFTGYIRLDDTASWLGLADRALTHGTSLGGLEASSYEAMLDFYLGSGYPLGGLLPMGIAGRLSGQDLAWIWQPHLAFLALLLALSLWEAARGAIQARPGRAVAVVVASQPASLFAYTIWGGFKELAAAALLPAVAVLGVRASREHRSIRDVLALGVTCAGFLGVLSVGGAVWMLALLVPVLVVLVRAVGARQALRPASFVLVLVLVMSVPPMANAGFLDAPAASTITTQDRLANLIQPLSVLQIFGIWPAGDFRLRPDRLDETYVLIAVAVACALLGILAAWRARADAMLLYVLGAVVGGLVIYAFGSPWVDAKALSIAAPATLLPAGVGTATLWTGGRRIEAGALAALIAGGVLWSNGLAYRDVTIAPRDRLAELATINDRFKGLGPTLMTEFEPYGARYFLRDMAPEGAAELRRRPVELRNGQHVPKGATADLDDFSARAVLIYEVLVLRRSPFASRPPSLYRRTWTGRYYEVWQREETSSAQIVTRLPLGSPGAPGGRATCADVLRLARGAGSNGRLIAARPPTASASTVDSITPLAAWTPVPGSRLLRPTRSGRISTSASVSVSGRYDVWVPGATRSQLEVALDGQRVGATRAELSYPGQFIPIGSVELAAGRHGLELRYAGADAAPGSKGSQFAIGAPVLSLSAAPPALLSYTPSRARALCGRTLDWIEVVRRAG